MAFIKLSFDLIY